MQLSTSVEITEVSKSNKPLSLHQLQYYGKILLSIINTLNLTQSGKTSQHKNCFKCRWPSLSLQI